MDSKYELVTVLQAIKSIPAVRVSSAKARGAAKLYSYWGAVRYSVRLGRDGLPHNVANECASSDRRSKRLAHCDADVLALVEKRCKLDAIGLLTDQQCRHVLNFARQNILACREAW